MAIRGFSINISKRLSGTQATAFAQWIGAANVMRNQKILEYRGLLSEGNGTAINQGYSRIKQLPELPFLKPIPVQLLRNAACGVFSDAEAARKGLRKFPKIKARHKKRSVVITKELFMLEPLAADQCLLTFFDNATKARQKLFSIKVPYRSEQLGKQFRISRQGATFTLSGAFDDGSVHVTNEQLLADYANLDAAELLQQITGIDRGVVRLIQTSDGLVLAYSLEEVRNLKKQARRKAHYQRILARKKRLNGNKNKHRCETNKQRQLATKIAQADHKIGTIRKYFSHRASKQVVQESRAIISLEDLNLTGMTKRAKPKRKGRQFVKNNARAKSGLNRSLLNVAMGRMSDFIQYKAVDAGKASVKINPVNSSKECHACGSLNTSRPTQALFICRDCGTVENADFNAAKVIAKRAVTYIKENTFADKAKPRKTIARRKKKVVDPPLVCELASV